MTAIAEFFDMGGYAGFIWPCFIVTGLVLAGLLFSSMREWRGSEEVLRGLRRERRRGVDSMAEDDAG